MTRSIAELGISILAASMRAMPKNEAFFAARARDFSSSP